MKYEVLKNGMAKNGRSFTCGRIVELDEDYAKHLVGRGILQPVNFEKAPRPKKSRAVSKPSDLEQAVEE
jgi:hypothetical protein